MTRWYTDLNAFESIGLDTVANIVLQKSDTPALLVTTRQGIPHIEAHVQKNRLYICDRQTDGEPPPQPTLYISYTESFCGLVVHNSGNVSCREPIRTVWFGVVQNGRGNINLDVDVLLLDATVTKAGSLILSGSAEAAVLRNHKTGNMDAGNLEATSASIEILGSGSVSIHVCNDFRANILGTGDVLYKGQPRLKSVSITGSGRIKPLVNHFENMTFYG